MQATDTLYSDYHNTLWLPKKVIKLMKKLILPQEQNCVTCSPTFLPLFFSLLVTELIIEWLLKITSPPSCTLKNSRKLIFCISRTSKLGQVSHKTPFFSGILYSSMYVSTPTIPTVGVLLLMETLWNIPRKLFGENSWNIKYHSLNIFCLFLWEIILFVTN